MCIIYICDIWICNVIYIYIVICTYIHIIIYAYTYINTHALGINGIIYIVSELVLPYLPIHYKALPLIHLGRVCV